MTSSESERYRADLTSPDRTVRAVAQRQLARLERAAAPRAATEQRDTDAVDLLSLIEKVVGPLKQRSNGSHVGPCPWHSSKSGECLVVFADGRQWFCSSCRRSGGAARWIMQTQGISFGQACQQLGLPVRPRGRAPRRIEVTV